MGGLVSAPQFVSLSLTAGQTTNTATISSVTVANSLMERVGSTGTTFSVDNAEVFCELTFDGATTIRATRGQSGSALTLDILIKEYDSAVETVTMAMTGAEATDSVTLGTSVTRANTYLVGSYQTSSTGGFSSTMLYHRINSGGTAAEFGRDTASGTVDGTFFVVNDSSFISTRWVSFTASGWWGATHDAGDPWDHDTTMVIMSCSTPYDDIVPTYHPNNVTPPATRTRQTADDDTIALTGIISGPSGTCTFEFQLVTLSGGHVETWVHGDVDADTTSQALNKTDWVAAQSHVHRPSTIAVQGDSQDLIRYTFDEPNDDYDLTNVGTSGNYIITIQVVEEPEGAAGSTIEAAGAAYAVSGGAANLIQGRVLPSAGASYTVSGGSANLVHARTLAAAGAAFAVSGGAANLIQGRVIAAEGDTFSVSGGAANLVQGRVLAADGAAFAVSGGSATMTYDGGFVAEGAAYTVSGGSATMTYGQRLAAEGTAYAVSGGAANLIQGRVLPSAGAAYAVSGGAANLIQGRVIAADGAAFAVSGGSATMTVQERIAAEGAAFVVSGGSATMTYSDAPSGTYQCHPSAVVPAGQVDGHGPTSTSTTTNHPQRQS